MTRREAIAAVDAVLDRPEILAEDILLALDDALDLEPEIDSDRYAQLLVRDIH